MPFVDANLNHLAPIREGEGSAGPRSSFSDNFVAKAELQYRKDSMRSLDAELRERYRRNLQLAQEKAGQELPDLSDTLGSVVNRQFGLSPYGGMVSNEYTDRQLKRFDEENLRLSKLKEQFPEIETFDDMLEGVRRTREQVQRTADDVGSRAGFLGMLGGFAGTVGGSISERDPLLVASLFFPGFGRSIALRVLSEVGIGSATEALQQFGSVQPTQRMLGEQQINPWASIVAAGVGAGLVRGAFEGAAPAYRAAERVVAPQRARLREQREILEAAFPGLKMPLRNPTNEDLYEAIISDGATPIRRAAAAALERDMDLARTNPYGSGREAQALLREDLEITLRQMEGDTSVSVRPFLPALADEQGRIPDVLQKLGRDEAPQVYQRLDEVKARLDLAEQELQVVSQARSGRTMADAIGLVDAPSGARAAQILEELDGATPAARRAELERELDLVVNNLGVERIARAEQDFNIGPKKQLKERQRARNAARKEFRKVEQEAKKVEEKILNRMRAEERLAKMMARPEAPVMGGRPSKAGAQQEARTVAELDKTRLTDAAAIVARNTPPPPRDTATGQDAEAIPEPQPDTLDIGFETRIPNDLEVVVGVNEKGEAITMRARALMDDLADDDALMEAMRSCAI